MDNRNNADEQFVSYELEHALKRQPIKGTLSGMRTVLDRMRGNYRMHVLRKQKRKKKALSMIIAAAVILPLLLWATILYVRN
jgi:hypothetical protein